MRDQLININEESLTKDGDDLEILKLEKRNQKTFTLKRTLGNISQHRKYNKNLDVDTKLEKELIVC